MTPTPKITLPAFVSEFLASPLAKTSRYPDWAIVRPYAPPGPWLLEAGDGKQITLDDGKQIECYDTCHADRIVRDTVDHARARLPDPRLKIVFRKDPDESEAYACEARDLARNIYEAISANPVNHTLVDALILLQKDANSRWRKALIDIGVLS